MVKVGFSKISLDTAADEERVVNESIEGVFLYLDDGQSRALWATLDYMDFNKKYTDTVRGKISERTSLPEECIHVLTTHNHGGGKPDTERLAELCAKGAALAIASSKPAKMRYKFTEVDRKVSILRRLYIPEIEGVSTVYYGSCEKNGFDSSIYKENVITAMKEGRECHVIADSNNTAPVPFTEGDRELFVAEFTDYSGSPIGSIVRFASHAVCANRPGVYSSDYPYYVRKTMEEGFGGTSLFLNGPCGEIAPAMSDKFEGRERTLGAYLASSALEAVKDEEYTELKAFSDEKKKIMLPMRNEVLRMKVDIPESMPKALPEIRRYLEKKALERTLPFLDEKYREGESTVSESIPVYIGLLGLNDLLITAFPGETFNKTARAVKDAFPEKKIVTVTEHERTAMYLPPKEDFDLGGYETVCKLTAREAEDVLRYNVINFLSQK